MKSLAKRPNIVRQNAWGRDARFTEEDFEIETADVGHVRDNYLGAGHRRETLRSADVGRVITVYSSPGWTCWAWATLTVKEVT